MNRLKERWARGGSAVGVWSLIPEAVTTEVVARAGFDFVCIDNQHGVNDYSSTVHMLQAVALGSSVPLVRVPWNEPGVIGRMLDAGAQGIVVPMVNSVDEAEAAVRACRYPPEGARSYGPVAAGLRGHDYASHANADIACIPMIETVAAVEALDEILALRGIDAIYVGPADLSISLGLDALGSESEPAFVEALETILDGCSRHDIPAGIHASPTRAQHYLEIGFRMVTVTSDLAALRDGLAHAVPARPLGPHEGEHIY